MPLTCRPVQGARHTQQLWLNLTWRRPEEVLQFTCNTDASKGSTMRTAHVWHGRKRCGRCLGGDEPPGTGARNAGHAQLLTMCVSLQLDSLVISFCSCASSPAASSYLNSLMATGWLPQQALYPAPCTCTPGEGLLLPLAPALGGRLPDDMSFGSKPNIAAG